MNFLPLIRSLAISIGAPLVIVELLLHRGTSVAIAYLIAALPPLIMTVISLARRRIDPIGVLGLAGVALGIGLTAFSGNPVFAVAKESIFTGILGCAFLISLATPRPLTFVLAGQMTAGSDTAAQAAWTARLSNAAFVRRMRMTTLVWGAAFILDALLRVLAAIMLAPGTATAVSAVISVVIFGGLILWSRHVADAVKAHRSA